MLADFKSVYPVAVGIPWLECLTTHTEPALERSFEGDFVDFVPSSLQVLLTETVIPLRIAHHRNAMPLLHEIVRALKRRSLVGREVKRE